LIDEGTPAESNLLDSSTVDLLTRSLDARRYFKQSEIVLYRQTPEIAAGAGQQTQITGAPPPERAQ
jgi:hypothetical protein